MAARVSPELTEIRTVHSRARTALVTLERIERFRAEGHPAYRNDPADPEVDEIRAALQQVVALTERWARR